MLRFRQIALLVALTAQAGCTMTRHHDVKLRTEPSGATVYRVDAGEKTRVGTTPMEISQEYTATTSELGNYLGFGFFFFGGITAVAGGALLTMGPEFESVESSLGTLGAGVGMCLIGWLLVSVLTDETPTNRAYAVALDGFEEKEFELEVPGEDRVVFELDPAWYARYGIRSSAELTGESAVARLIPALADPRPAVRQQAVAAFASMSRADARAKRALQDVARADPDPDIRRLAEAALRKLRFVQMAAVPAGGGETPVVAVFDVFDPGGNFEPGLIQTLSTTLAAVLAETGAYRLVPREQVRAQVRKAKGESYRRAYDESSQIEMGKALSARKTLATQLLRVGRGCALSATFFDLETETAGAGALVETGCSEEELLGAVRQVVRKLMEQESSRPAG